MAEVKKECATMAEWFRVEMRWMGRAPEKERVRKLERALRAVDYDFPDVEKMANGGDDWRAPVLQLDVVLAFFHSCGFPCDGRMVKNEIDGPEVWEVIVRKAWMNSMSCLMDLTEKERECVVELMKACEKKDADEDALEDG